jgi:hypothetical protein
MRVLERTHVLICGAADRMECILVKPLRCPHSDVPMSPYFCTDFREAVPFVRAATTYDLASLVLWSVHTSTNVPKDLLVCLLAASNICICPIICTYG